MKKKSFKTIGVIPARWGSTRFPGKSLALICGKPLIQWVIERVSQAKMLDKILVATDDQRIAEAVKKSGGDAVLTRSDHLSGTDRVAEAAAGYAPEIIVNIQGDEPTIEPLLIDKLVKAMHAEKKWDMATAAAPLNSAAEAGSPSVCKVVFSQKGQALYFSRFSIPFVRDQTFSTNKVLYWRHIGIYLYRKNFLAKFTAQPPCLLETAEALEQLRALYIGARIFVLPSDYCGTAVDTPADIAAAEAALKRLKLKDCPAAG